MRNQGAAHFKSAVKWSIELELLYDNVVDLVLLFRIYGGMAKLGNATNLKFVGRNTLKDHSLLPPLFPMFSPRAYSANIYSNLLRMFFYARRRHS